MLQIFILKKLLILIFEISHSNPTSYLNLHLSIKKHKETRQKNLSHILIHFQYTYYHIVKVLTQPFKRSESRACVIERLSYRKSDQNLVRMISCATKCLPPLRLWSKYEIFHEEFLQKMWPNSQFPADLVTLLKKSLRRFLLCVVCLSSLLKPIVFLFLLFTHKN